jgi:ABC-type sugar transport system substrate-binding protein
MAEQSVALCLVDRSNDFQQLLLAEAEQASHRTGLALEVRFSGHDLAAQFQTLHALVDTQPRPVAILALAVRDRGLLRIAGEALKAGISFVYLNRTEDDVATLRAQAPAGVTACTVCADEVETGRIQGRQARALLQRQGTLLYVQGSTRSLAARDRTAGMQQATRGAAFEVALLEAGWTAAEARDAVAKWLGIVARGSLRVDLIGTQNDQMASGVIEALGQLAREMGKPELARIPVCGCDGTPALGQRLVREGKLVSTVVLPRSSGRAIEVVAHLLRGELPPPLVALPPCSFPELGALRPL